MANKTIRVATDVGGTFTDLVCFETDHATGESRIITAKSDTTPPNFEQGVLNVLAKGGVDPKSRRLPRARHHGRHQRADRAQGRQGRADHHRRVSATRWRSRAATGPTSSTCTTRSRSRSCRATCAANCRAASPTRARRLKPLDLSGLPAILDDFRADGVEAVAICFLHSYANTGHEQAALAEVQKLWPDVSVVSSHQITREWREYERTNTAVLSAYVQPTAERYLSRLHDGLRRRASTGALYIMQSNCGVDSLESVSKIPITMVESGPASGFWGAAELGKLIGEPNVLALDIGGTTAKCSLIENGEVKIKTDYWIERDRTSAGYPIMVPVVDLVEIGNGGGSIAWVDDFGKLHVGPQSAGAVPGPGRLWPRRHARPRPPTPISGSAASTSDYFCGGEIVADMEAAEAALKAVGEKLGVDADEAARGIIRIANNNMVNALKLVSLNRGHDPRDFTLVAFGGGGGMHGVALAAELGVRKVVVPAGASVFSAWGMMMSDLRRDYFVTRLADLRKGAAAGIEAVFAESRGAGAERSSRPKASTPPRSSSCAMASSATRTRSTRPRCWSPAARSRTSGWPRSRRRSTRPMSANTPTVSMRPVEMVGIHLVASAEVGKLTMRKREATGAKADAALKGHRDVDYALEGVHERGDL